MNPFLLDLPAVVATSGGRTSGYMLRRILDAHDGQPDDLKVVFCNTGLEHAATYEFLREMEERWGVAIDWIEYDLDQDGEHDFRVVDFETAARDGEPFTQLIEKKGYLPNPVARVCSSNLKMRTLDRYLKTLPAFADSYTNAIGLRADEPNRAQRIKSDNGREAIICPLYDAGLSEDDVLAFWAANDFDLDLPLSGNAAGNCVGCFLKKRSKLELLMKELPEYFDWWVEAEEGVKATAKTGARFRQDRPSYSKMMEGVRRQGWLPFSGNDDLALPCICHD